MNINTKKLLFVAVPVFIVLPGFSQPAPQIIPLTSPLLWQRLEFGVGNVPSVGNPFDPDSIRLDATFTFPSGRAMVVPGFWYQGYERSLLGGYEHDIPTDAGGWRFRFTPPETGSYSLSLTIQTNGLLAGGPVSINFNVPTNPPPVRSGYVGIAPGGRYFQTGDGQPLRLIGQNFAWGDEPQTYSYDTWFAHMQSAGENFARIWMYPYEFGIEVSAASLTNYSLQPAWQLDYVLQLAEQRGIYLLLCLDYHEMLGDGLGGDNEWPVNPYNASNGGPCIVANDFFTNPTAQWLYQKRLRYLIARYGYSQNLIAWEFFNEIDNDYSFLNSTNVADWHGLMGGWLHTNDVFGHLVTTSLTGESDRPEIWSLPQLDFAAYHSYSERAPAARLNTVAQSFLQRYGKPMMIGEFATSGTAWNRTNDLYLRGWRQGIWGGALGGSVGTAMSWWWQSIDAENDYSVYASLGAILNRTGWGRGVWTNITFQTGGAPVTVGDPLPDGQPLNVTLPLGGHWGDLTSGQLAVPGPIAAGYSASALQHYVHGIYESGLKTPFVLNAWLTNDARLVLHLNSVADGSIIVVSVDGNTLLSTNFPDLDGDSSVDEEYDLDIPVNLPAGLHSITITNSGLDWFYLDWVRLEQVLPATYAGSGPPVTVGDPLPEGQSVNVTLPLGGHWGDLTSGQLAVPGEIAAGYSASALEHYAHGIYQSALKTPFVLNAWLTNDARLVLHLNSVSDGSIMVVIVDGNTLLSTNLPNLDGVDAVDDEYNLDIPVNLPAGLHSITITNSGLDWFYLDWVRLEQVLPATYADNWSPAAIGLQGPHESLLYLVAPGVSWPTNANAAPLPVQHAQAVTLAHWPAGQFIAEWYDPATGAALGTSQATTTNRTLTLPLPDYTEDLAAIVYPPPQLAAAGFSSTNGFRFRLDSETGGHYLIQTSSDLVGWLPFLEITNTTGTMFLTNPSGSTNAQSFFRALKVN